MQVFIMRHANAENLAPSDSERPLSTEGIEEAQIMGKWFNSQNFNIDQVFVSPYLRAQQTLEQVLKELEATPKVTTLDFITPDGSVQQAHDYLDGFLSTEGKTGNCRDVLIISHMPLVSYLIAEITVEYDAPILSTAGVARVDYSPKEMHGHLKELHAPGILSKSY